MIVIAYSERHWPRPFIVLQKTLSGNWTVLGRERTREDAEKLMTLFKTTPKVIKNLSDFL